MDMRFEAIALLVLITTTIFAYVQIMGLDMKADTILQFDDILLLITIPFVFVAMILDIMAAFKNQNILQVCIAVLRVCDVIIQTVFIIDGRRRCMKRKSLQNKKSGRELIIFLVIGNSEQNQYWSRLNNKSFHTFLAFFFSKCVILDSSNIFWQKFGCSRWTVKIHDSFWSKKRKFIKIEYIGVGLHIMDISAGILSIIFVLHWPCFIGFMRPYVW